MNKYIEVKRKHEKMINDFPMAFAFSEKQFEEAKIKLSVKSNEELLRIPSGGLIRKSDKQKFRDMVTNMNKDSENNFNDDDYLYHGFLYELSNHEYCITYDPTDTLDCFNLTIEQVENDNRLKTLFNKAKKTYFKNINW